MKNKFILFAFNLMLVCCAIGYCYASEYPESAEDRRDRSFGSIIGSDKETGQTTIFGHSIGGNKKDKEIDRASEDRRWIDRKSEKAYKKKGAGRGDFYLWQAALEVVQFMPILVSDSKGGVLSTDWYEDAEFPNERYKVNIIIKSPEVDSKSLQVVTFKQAYKDNKWQDIKANPKVSSDMKEKILAKAKQFQSE